MANIENILATCITDIKAGRHTPESCLASYPSVREQLEPLLNIALSIKEPPAFKPTRQFKIKARVQLMEYIQDNKIKEKSRDSLLQRNIRELWSGRWLKTATITAAILLVLSTITTTTTYAANNSLPGDILYPLKIAIENTRSRLTFDNKINTELELSFASRRLQEIEALVNKNINHISLANNGYERNINNAVTEAEKIEGKDDLIDELEIISMALLSHADDIDEIINGTHAEERELLSHTLEIAFSTQQRALRSLAEYDPLKATVINIFSLQNRLDRAIQLANAGEILGADQALRQFQEMLRFGREIAEKAKKSGIDIENINTSSILALSNQIGIIDTLEGTLPNDIIASTKDALGESFEYHGKDSEGTQANGNNAPQDPASQPDEPSSDTTEPGNQPEEPGNMPEEPGSQSEEPGKNE